MRTVLKVPIYVMVETEKNLDRAVISRVANTLIFPLIQEYLAKAKFSKTEKEEFVKALGSHAEFSFQTELDLLEKS